MSNITQITRARAGEITPEILKVAEKEKRSPESIRAEVAAGAIVIPANINHKSLDPIGIGKTLFTKINANIGNSTLSSCPKLELEKLRTALKYGADTVMDLSTGSNITNIRQTIVNNSPAPIGTVPVYEALSRIKSADQLTDELILQVIREQAEQGVDYMTIHAGLLREHIPMAKERMLRIVSRGGSILAKWMQVNNRQNLFYENFDKILEICKQYDVTLSLGDGLRPGCLADASDAAQFAELKELGGLVSRCRAAGVQAMVEGPGHVPLDQIEMNMKMEDEICQGAPFYILGPVVIDCAPGYDHITSAIGATLGAYYGAAMLCYVTPKEHLGLPNAEDVRNGVIAYKIAAHAADVALKRPGARKRDDEISKARAEFDWQKQFELALDPGRAREFRQQALDESNAHTGEHASVNDKDHFCTMCGPDFCSMRISREL
ncbi:MAG: phosphomethylpyrimidine synthase ThiC [Victivallaceae bacterium]